MFASTFRPETRQTTTQKFLFLLERSFRTRRLPTIGVRRRVGRFDSVGVELNLRSRFDKSVFLRFRNDGSLFSPWRANAERSFCGGEIYPFAYRRADAFRSADLGASLIGARFFASSFVLQRFCGLCGRLSLARREGIGGVYPTFIRPSLADGKILR